MKLKAIIFVTTVLFNCLEINGQNFLGGLTGAVDKSTNLFGGFSNAVKGGLRGGSGGGSAGGVQEGMLGGVSDASKLIGGLASAPQEAFGGFGSAPQDSQIIGFPGANNKGILGGLTDAAKGAMGGMLPSSNVGCKRDIVHDYQKAILDFTMRLYKRVAFYNKDHFVMSPLSVWISLAALAEGADGILQRELFTALNLPVERCLREKYYKIAVTREVTGNDVRFSRRRQMIMDQGLRVNNTWANYVKTMNLLDISLAPIKSNPQAVASQLRKFMGTRSPPRLSSNSALIDSLIYEGLWTTAFPEAEMERGPFYDDAGIMIGTVDYMKIKKRIKLAHIPMVNGKLLEMPVGNSGRYKMMILIGLSKDSISSRIEMFVNTIITEILANLKESLIPLDVAIPRFAMNFEFEANSILDEIGAGSLWKNPETTWLISHPPAQPSGLYQRVSFKMGTAGLESVGSPNILNPIEGFGNIASGMATGLVASVGRDFIANRPFMYGLFDTETMTCVLAGAYAKPDV